MREQAGEGTVDGGIPIMFTREMLQAMADLGYGRKVVGGFTPAEAHGIIQSGAMYKRPEAAAAERKPLDPALDELRAMCAEAYERCVELSSDERFREILNVVAGSAEDIEHYLGENVDLLPQEQLFLRMAQEVLKTGRRFQDLNLARAA